MNAENQAKPVKPIAFLHLIKCAGTTLEAILRRQYGDSRIIQFGSVQDAEKKLDRFEGLPDGERKQIHVLMGHFNVSQRSRMPSKATCITMLRDPVDRIISEYYYILAHSEHEFYDKVAGKKLSLTEFARSRTYQTLDNQQTKYLSGVGKLKHGEYSAEAVALAKKNLAETFAITGLTERFDESVILMKRIFGWQTPYYVREKVTPNRPPRETVPEDAIECIRKYNRMDLEIYEHASRNFEEIASRQHPGFHLEVEAFGYLNERSTEYLEAARVWRDQPQRAEYHFLLNSLNGFLKEKKFEAAEAVIAYAIGQFPDASELYTISEMLKSHLAYTRRLAAQGELQAPAAPVEKEEPALEEQQ
jgi:hypothetical protein